MARLLWPALRAVLNLYLLQAKVFVWYPAANDNGNGKAAFTVKAVDPSNAVSDAVAVSVNVVSNNTAPNIATLTYTKTGVTRNSTTEIYFC